MEGFKSNPKMQCFKEGGTVKYETRKEHAEEVKADINQDKKIVKKAISMHDKQEHKGEKTDLSKLRSGGRAKKSTGTVKKFKSGGSVNNVYEAKKSSGDKDNIAKVKATIPAKAAAPSKAAQRPNLKGSDVAKEKSKPAGHEDPYIKSKESGKSADAPSKAAVEPKNTPAKFCGGKSVKKMADGRLTGPLGAAADMENLRMLGRAANAKKYLGPAQQSQFMNQGGMNPAPAGITPPAAAPSAPVNAMGDATGMGNIPYRKGGKVKKAC
jgi:cytochrome c553